ncbi:DUF3489 domain-containing protein [Tepidimonas sp. HKU77]|uniref:DUF3489 domain-containing protein n=1 Tax=Tepidimonas sp. HKU77 TaxID=3414503 RepID=UPI003C7E366F
MDTTPKLTPTQTLLLRTAAHRADGQVIPPETLRGGARVKVLTALLDRGWIEPADGDHVLTDAGYAAIGQQRPVPPDGVAKCDTTDGLQLLEGIPVRPGTKLAALVVALRRPQGATSLQLMLATGWQPHSVRGAISGLLRKRLGLNVVLTHNAAGERVTASADGQPRRKGSEFRSGPWGTHDLRTLAVLPVAGRGGSAGLQTANPANLGLHPDAIEAPRSRPPHGWVARKDP